MIMHLPLSITPSITISSSLYGQYSMMSVCSSSLLCGQPAIINVLVVVGGHSAMMNVVFPLWICILACLLRSGWHPLVC